MNGNKPVHSTNGMNENKPVLIVEHSTNGLNLIQENVGTQKKDYILGGIFTEFDVVNRNERIYTSEKFLPHLAELNERKKALTVIYGEFDHPDVFDTSLARVSHTLESIFHNPTANRIEGTIRLLNTHWGKEAKALVDDGCPIFVSSRAAGITESNGTVAVKKLFTYDAVADPGFGSARMEMKSLNESLGFTNESSNFRIYDLSDTSKFNEYLDMNNNNEFVTKNQMIEYSNYLTEQIESVQRFFNENSKGGVEPQKMHKMAEILENLNEQQIAVNQYLDYLAEQLQFVVNENSTLKNKTEGLVKHNDYLAEELEKSINYSEYIAEKLDKNIDYSEYIAETLDKNIDFSEYIAENVDKNIQYSDYLAESIEKNIDYSEYIAENLDKNILYSEYIAENLDKNIEYAEYIAEHVDNNIEYTEYVAEHVDNNIEYTEYVAEHVDNNIAYSEYVAENVSDTQAYQNYLAESLDKTISHIGDNKLNENQQVQMPTLKVQNVEQFYDDNDEEFSQVQTQNAQTLQSQVQQGAQAQVQLDAQAQAQTELDAQAQIELDAQAQLDGQAQLGQTQAQIQTELDAQDVQGVQAQLTDPSIQVQPTSVQGEVLNTTQITPGDTGVYNDQPGEVIAYSPQENLVVLRLTDTAEEIQVHESKVTIINSTLNETNNTLKSQIGTLITETRKRKVAADTVPHFLQFLTEKNKQSFYGLSNTDQEKVKLALNESTYYSENQILKQISDTLSVKKTFEDVLIENIPSDLKPIYENLTNVNKKSLLDSAKMYPNLNTSAKMEAFWNSRKLENYSIINESRQTMSNNKLIDNSSLSEEQLNRFYSRLKNI